MENFSRKFSSKCDRPNRPVMEYGPRLQPEPRLQLSDFYQNS